MVFLATSSVVLVWFYYNKTMGTAETDGSAVRMAESYGENTATHKSIHKRMVEMLRPKLKSYLSENKVHCLTVGDIGCADGRNSMSLYRMLAQKDEENPKELNPIMNRAFGSKIGLLTRQPYHRKW